MHSKFNLTGFDSVPYYSNLHFKLHVKKTHYSYMV